MLIMKTILYIHGFNSAGFGETAEKIRNYFGKENVYSPTLPPSPLEAIVLLKNLFNSLVSAGKDVTVIGNSLGGFYALYLHHLNDCKTILINPSLKPFNSLKPGKYINYVSGIEYEFTQEHIQELQKIFGWLNEVENVNALLHIFYSLNDELIDHPNTTLKRYHFAKTKVCCKESTHRFEKLEDYLPQFQKIIEN